MGGQAWHPLLSTCKGLGVDGGVAQHSTEGMGRGHGCPPGGARRLRERSVRLLPRQTARPLARPPASCTPRPRRPPGLSVLPLVVESSLSHLQIWIKCHTMGRDLDSQVAPESSRGVNLETRGKRRLEGTRQRNSPFSAVCSEVQL